MTKATALDAIIVAQAPDALICSDPAGTIIRWNRMAEVLFGHSEAEALGQSLDLIIPPHLREAHWRGFRHAMDTGHTKHHGQAVFTSATHKDGSRVYADVAFSLVTADDGQVVGTVAIARPKKRDS